MSKPLGPELFFGLVGALGADLPQLSGGLSEALATFGYATVEIRLSTLLREIPKYATAVVAPLDERITQLQEAGDDLRELTGAGHALAALAMAGIRNARERAGAGENAPLPRTAYILNSLKHPDEAILLQRTYGSSFFLVAAYSPTNRRKEVLTRSIAESHQSAKDEEYSARAEALLHRDEAEQGRPLGQRVRETFPLADVFVDTSRPDHQASGLKRFCEMIFGHPFHTPTRDEFAMFHARAAALRSADPSRQVGAVITTTDGDVIAIGTNEVPKPGGGLYWPGDTNDSRDFQLREAHSISMRRRMLGEILSRLRDQGWLSQEMVGSGGASLEDLVEKAEPHVNDSLLMDVGEFGRTVHAEMAALIDAARRGTAVEGQTLFSTTFPCHNCTKHIVAAGISRVVYVEPFPKSQATRLHGDAITVDGDGPSENRVSFCPFVGVAPRRFMEFFTMLKRKQPTGKPAKVTASQTPRFPLPGSVLGYLEEEKATVRDLHEKMLAAGLIGIRKNGRKPQSTARRRPRHAGR